jgi:hypothetical protein
MTKLKRRIFFLRQTKNETCDSKTALLLVFALPSNGLRYLRWGGDGEAVQPEKCRGVGNCLRLPQNPQRQVHALLARINFDYEVSIAILSPMKRAISFG